jgi:hypothetical protein
MLVTERDDSLSLGCTHDVKADFFEHKFCALGAAEFLLSGRQQDDWRRLRAAWDNLDPDEYYGGGDAGERHRRYSDFEYLPGPSTLTPLEHTAYLQSKRMNRYVGGVKRHFADVLPETYDNEFFRALVRFAFNAFPIPEQLRDSAWVCQVHQIRILVHEGQTTAVTPEGIHSDGYPFASVHLIDRVGVSGGVSSVYSGEEEELATLTFETPLDTLLLEDRALKHYVTPIQSSGGEPGHRSILAISLSLPNSPFTTDV